jgi:hypothetical protein
LDGVVGALVGIVKKRSGEACRAVQGLLNGCPNDFANIEFNDKRELLSGVKIDA